MKILTIDEVISLQNEINKVTRHLKPENLTYKLNGIYPLNILVEPVDQFGGFCLHLDEPIENKKKINLSLLAQDLDENTAIGRIHNHFKRYLRNLVFPVVEAKGGLKVLTQN